jgi:hypothetical protein
VGQKCAQYLYARNASPFDFFQSFTDARAGSVPPATSTLAIPQIVVVYSCQVTKNLEACKNWPRIDLMPQKNNYTAFIEFTCFL